MCCKQKPSAILWKACCDKCKYESHKETEKIEFAFLLSIFHILFHPLHNPGVMKISIWDGNTPK